MEQFFDAGGQQAFPGGQMGMVDFDGSVPQNPFQNNNFANPSLFATPFVTDLIPPMMIASEGWNMPITGTGYGSFYPETVFPGNPVPAFTNNFNFQHWNHVPDSGPLLTPREAPGSCGIAKTFAGISSRLTRNLFLERGSWAGIVAAVEPRAAVLGNRTTSAISRLAGYQMGVWAIFCATAAKATERSLIISLILTSVRSDDDRSGARDWGRLLDPGRGQDVTLDSTSIGPLVHWHVKCGRIGIDFVPSNWLSGQQACGYLMFRGGSSLGTRMEVGGTLAFHSSFYLFE
ncbi:hypothetical protein PG984_000148 [Apiospora sp. TS-2023a]